MAREELRRRSGVLAGDRVDFRQDSKRAKRDVLEVADGRGHHVERACHFPMISSPGMAPSARNKPIGVIEVLVALSCFVFFIPAALFLRGEQPPPGESWQYWMVGISGTILVGGSILLILRKRRKDKLRDWFCDWSVAPFECAGVHLIPIISPPLLRPGGVARYCVFYQNRFESNTRLQVRLEPGPKFIGVNKLPSASWDLEIGPAEVGMVWRNLPLSPDLEIGKLTLVLAASGRNGIGSEVRYRPGIVLSPVSKSMIAVTVADAQDLVLSQAPPEGRIHIANLDGDPEDEYHIEQAMEIAGVEER